VAVCILLGAEVVRADDDALEIAKDDQTLTLDCSGREVKIPASRSQITLTGECVEVDVKGSENTIRIDTAKKLEVWGNSNTIHVVATKKIQAAGDDNVFRYVRGIGKKHPGKKSWGKRNVFKRVTEL
jgi:hypothetical protein